MTCARSASLIAASLLVLAVGTVQGADAKPPRTDLYGDPLPPGAVARLGTIRLRHAEADVVFSKDGKQLISCGRDREVRFWDAATGKLVRRTRLVSRVRRYFRAYLSPDGATAAVQEFPLFLHDTHSGAERGYIDSVARALVRFSPEGAAVVVEAAAEDGTRPLEIWDVARVKRRQRLADPSPDRSVIECVFSGDGKRLAGFTSAHDKIFFWDAQSGKLLGQKEGDGYATIEALAFSPDGKTLAAGWGPASNEPAQVQLLEAATYRKRAALPMPAGVHVKVFGKLAFSPDGRFLAGSYANDLRGEHGILLWDVAGTKEVRRLAERRSASFAFAPDGKTLACRDPGGSSLRLWDPATGRRRLDSPRCDRPVKAMAVSPNGKIIATDAGDGIELWDATTGRRLRTLERGGIISSPCLFSPDSERLICGAPGTDLALQEWDIATGKERRIFAFSAPSHVIHGLGISADGKRLAAVVSPGGTAVRSGQIFAWDALTGEQRSRRSFPCEGRIGAHFALSTVPPHSPLAFAPDGESVVRMWNEKPAGDDEYWRGLRLSLEDVSTGTLLAELPKGVGLPVVFSPNGRLLAAPVFSVASMLGRADMVAGLALIEAASGEEILRLEPGEFDYLAFTPEGRGLMTVSKKGVRIWDVETGRPLHDMAWPKDIVAANADARIHSLAVLPTGRLATAQSDGDILIWDLSAATWPNPTAPFDRKPPAALWSDLLRDARTAQRAIRALAAAPDPAIPVLSQRLTPLTADRARLDQLLADLDSDSFTAREEASHTLARLRERVMPRLRQTLQDKPSLELRLRIETLLAEPKRLPPDTVRTLRAIDALERIGTPEARHILGKMAGNAVAVEARAAQGALRRLNRR